MNQPSLPVPLARFGWIRPWWFLAGFLGGLVGVAWLGYRTSRTDYHPGFERFYPAISPETSYYPTLDEMAAIVRARCRRDQVLVVVGGNSILQGVWQPPHEIWSERLQELLGDRYCVVNFAFRGASPTDGGAVLAEALRKEFPHQIYIADEAPLTGVGSWGPESYRYLFWQAYFSGRLLKDPVRDQRVRTLQSDSAQKRALVETRISVWFDLPLHYKDLWNRVAYDDICTVPSYLAESIPGLLTPRVDYPDTEADATAPENVAHRYSMSVFNVEMEITRGADNFYKRRGPDGRWILPEATRQDISTLFATAFPDPLKPRTLMLISRSSPYYRRHLSPDDASREDQSFEDTLRLWHQAGYPAIQYGRDFTDDDYGDRTHLSKLGGAKLAALVAPEVRSLAKKLGYLP